MRKTFKHLAMAALASALIAGQATTAFAFKNDTNNGPGSGKSTEVSLQAPGDNSDSSQSSGNNTSPTTIVEESSQSTDTSQSETSQTTETTTETTTDTTTALLPRFRPTKLSYRYSFFVPLTRYGVIRSVMTLFFLWVMQDF